MSSKITTLDEFSVFDCCTNVTALLDENEREQFRDLPAEQKNMLRESAHDVTVNAIFKMMKG